MASDLAMEKQERETAAAAGGAPEGAAGAGMPG